MRAAGRVGDQQEALGCRIPVEAAEQVEGLGLANLHRRNPWVAESESEANNAAEAISVEEAIHAYTLGGAHALLREDRIGSIEKGSMRTSSSSTAACSRFPSTTSARPRCS